MGALKQCYGRLISHFQLEKRAAEAVANNEGALDDFMWELYCLEEESGNPLSKTVEMVERGFRVSQACRSGLKVHPLKDLGFLQKQTTRFLKASDKLDSGSKRTNVLK